MLAGCATVTTPTKGDPFESYNRAMFTINDKIDQVALKPIAKGYVYVTPQPVRDSVTNFFGNIGDIYTAANNLVQLKIADGVSDIMRVVMNSIFGVAGLFDVASVAGLPKHTQDFGLTLGHYGVPAGPYVVLPLLGPSTVRDTAGTVVDYFGSVTSYVDPTWFRTTLFGVQLVNTRANLLGAGDVLSGAALDKYSFVRNAYLQRRQYLIGGDTSASDGNESLPKYEDVGAPPAPGLVRARLRKPPRLASSALKRHIKRVPDPLHVQALSCRAHPHLGIQSGPCAGPGCARAVRRRPAAAGRDPRHPALPAGHLRLQ